MCGIAGIVGEPSDESVRAVRRMTGSIIHRGPDQGGLWAEPGVALGHRRLAIVDLSDAGAQPMQSADGRWILSFNGEIYNHKLLRANLEAAGDAPAWRGHSDTESLLACVAAWGVDEALRKAHGMFALALWDRTKKRLVLARDRFGEKPLYLGFFGNSLVFASELKAFHKLPDFDSAIDTAAVRHLLGRGYIPANKSIYARVSQVQPGTWHEYTSAGKPISSHLFFDYPTLKIAGLENPLADPKEASELMREALAKSVAQQMVADVGVGTLLSGGIDSSLVTALAARCSSRPVKSYSIGFAEAGYDEAPMAREVARHLGTDHHERYVTADEVLKLVPELPDIYDEPLGDSSQLPTIIVSRFAREEVTVALTGDGGDEIFAGYRRHIALPGLWAKFGPLPTGLRSAMGGLGAAIPPSVWNKLAAARTRSAVPTFLGHKVRRSLRISGSSATFAGFASSFLDEWDGYASPVLDQASLEPLPGLDGPGDARERLALSDALSYLPGDILTKVDRAAMAVSLEGRMPLLDPDVAALAARLPTSEKVSGGSGKVILRRLLSELVPLELFDRPKAGFAIPLSTWLRHQLRDWAESLLSEEALLQSGLLNPVPIRQRWLAHCEGREDASQAIWSVLAFQSWYERWHGVPANMETSWRVASG
jgi:asparagine synthase (glutamine-hydrolysing)